MSDEVRQVLRGLWPPLLVIVPLLIAVHGRWADTLGDRMRGRLTALGTGLAFLAAFWALKGFPALPPNRGDEWLVLGVLAAGLLGSVDPRPRAAWTIAAALVAAATPVAIAARLVATRWTATEAVVNLGIAIAVSIAARVHGATVPLAVAATAGVAALVLMAGFTASLGQLAGAVAAVATAIAAAGLWRRDRVVMGRGTALVAAIAVGGLLAGGCWLASVAVWRAVIVLLAPLACGVALLPPVARCPAVLRSALALAAVAAVLALPAWTAFTELGDDGY